MGNRKDKSFAVVFQTDEASFRGSILQCSITDQVIFFFAGKPDRFAVILAQTGPKPGVLSVIDFLQ
jgi:hypothetical protein